MINYISVRYEQSRDGGRRGGRTESFIIIRKGNVVIPEGDVEYVWEMRQPATPPPTELFQGQ